MSKELNKYPGTIAYALVQHKAEIFNALGTGTARDLAKAKAVVTELLQSTELKNNPATPKAIDTFNSLRNYNAFLSTLTTYMLGDKVIP